MLFNQHKYVKDLDGMTVGRVRNFGGLFRILFTVRKLLCIISQVRPLGTPAPFIFLHAYNFIEIIFLVGHRRRH